MRDAPANKPADKQDQDSQMVLGSTAPAQQQPVTIDQVAPKEVPVPRLGAASWSKTFPEPRTPAAFQLTRQGLDRLHEGKVQTGEWIIDKGKEKGIEKTIETIIEHLPFSEAMRGQMNNLSEQTKHFKELFEDRKKSTEKVIKGIFHVRGNQLNCLGSARMDGCEEEASRKIEEVNNEYGNREGKRWKPWLKEKDGGNRVAEQEPRKP